MTPLLELLPWALLPIVAGVCLAAGAGIRDNQLFSNPDRMRQARRRWSLQQRRKIVSRDVESLIGQPPWPGKPSSQKWTVSTTASSNGNGNGDQAERPAQYLRRTW